MLFDIYNIVNGNKIFNRKMFDSTLIKSSIFFNINCSCFISSFSTRPPGNLLEKERVQYLIKDSTAKRLFNREGG